MAGFACAVLLSSPASSAEKPGPRSAAVDLERYARVIHVDGARGDDVTGDGSADQPWASLPQALEEAGGATAEGRVAVLVAQGRYVQPTFVLRSHVDLFGGYARFSEPRDVYAHATVLDGEDDHRIAFGADDARIDGFHFVRGQVRGKGGALLCDGTSPVITNCIFTENRTLIPQPWAPPLLHETANDGGAVMCLNGAAPRIKHNLFYHNTTECGRGAALAADRGSAPQIVNNVFAGNRAGFDDPMRSSDGGAISFFDHSDGVITGNVIVDNAALTRNDGGGIFVALWSAPRIVDNIIAANFAGDDAGGLFIGGQEHRYDAPLDEHPPAGEYTVIVDGNVLVGNANSSANSGASRITMEARVRLTNNIITENEGGLYLQRSEVAANNNTVWQDWRFVEDKASLGPSRFTGNILKGPARLDDVRAGFENNMLDVSSIDGKDNAPVSDIFRDDGVNGDLVDLHFDPTTFTTVLTTKAALPAGADYAGRVVRLSDSETGGQWRVIQRAAGREIVLWGRLDAVTAAPRHFFILRTFTPKPEAPPGLGAGAR
ncbi:MAG: right-handed parallel beta-helix repeat-containing protein [Opitutaceae bacterium]